MNFYNKFKKCIICLQPPTDNLPLSKLTDEHIVSEFLGGNIIVKNVCKECNDRLGHRLEGPLSKNKYFKLYAYSNEIKGKKAKLTNPLSGEYLSSGKRFRFENDYSLYQLPIIKHQQTSDGGLKIEASLDISDIDRIEHDIFKTISRQLKNNGKTLKEDKLKKDIKKIIEGRKKNNISIINQPEIDVSFSLDFNAVALLALKISYELLAWIAGEDFILSSEFDNFRSSLKSILLHDELKYVMHNFHETFVALVKENPYFKVKDFSHINSIFAKNKTLVIFMSGACSVRVANLWINFKIPDSLKNMFLIFSSDSKTGIYNFYREEIFFFK